MSFLHDQSDPTPSEWLGAACVQQSLNQTRDTVGLRSGLLVDHSRLFTWFLLTQWNIVL